ncbi:chromosome segregation protein Csm1/Pcs1-domain-containing protein [Phycomyces nitens]|nr:chromosome segregation protein Csm1/Pcs1-domain-containing protein [Phycomyces nitens]
MQSTSKKTAMRYANPSNDSYPYNINGRPNLPKNSFAAKIYKRNAIFRPEEPIETDLDDDTASEIIPRQPSPPRPIKPSHGASEETRLLRQQLKKLEKDFEDLVGLRYTEPEEKFKEIEEKLAARTESTDEIIGHLQAMNDEKAATIEELEKELLETRKTVEMFGKEHDRNLKDSKDPFIEMYKHLTGLVFMGVKTSSTGTTYTCQQEGNTGKIQFKLTQTSDTNQGVQYEPLLDERKDAGLISILPEYLQKQIVFRTDKLRAFYTLLHSSLQSKAETTRDETRNEL